MRTSFGRQLEEDRLPADGENETGTSRSRRHEIARCEAAARVAAAMLRLLKMSPPGVRRDKAALSSGCKSHPANSLQPMPNRLSLRGRLRHLTFPSPSCSRCLVLAKAIEREKKHEPGRSDAFEKLWAAYQLQKAFRSRRRRYTRKRRMNPVTGSMCCTTRSAAMTSWPMLMPYAAPTRVPQGLTGRILPKLRRTGWSVGWVN